ncbi:hypothetical protein [Gordonia shandongensis]|uniref:hypothetical protein n=1 Tax=Gordonia shandongensis TaxID=376351 RepID=UPI00041BD110|nr:hypothetical protein [Gordonia shandongensis]
MSTGRPRKTGATGGPKRTPRVAGRNSPRVGGVHGDDTARTTRIADEAPADTRAAARGTVSGVERKRRAAAAAREAMARRSKAADREPSVNGTGRTYLLAGIVAAVAVVLAAVAAVLGLHPGAGVTENKAFVDQGETDRASAFAKTAVCTPFAYDYRDLDKSERAFNEQYAGEAFEEFRDYFPTLKKTIVQAKSTSDCRVDVVGIQDLTEDRAVGQSSMIVSVNGQAAPPESSQFFVQFTLEKNDDDQWRVTEYAQL